MIRRSTRKMVGNEGRAYQLWKVVASEYSHSRWNEDQQRQLISSSFGRHTGQETSNPDGEFGIIKSTVPDVHYTSPRQEDGTYFSLRKDRIIDQFDVSGRRDHRKWTGSNTRARGVVGYYSPERPSSGWSRKLGRSPKPTSSLCELWNRGGTRRLLSKKPREDDDSINSSPKETEEAQVCPKTIDDFQHEEIIGPTVDRDESDTANQLRASLNQLTNVMTSLTAGFIFLGSVQLLAALWSSCFHGGGLIVGISQNLTFAMSFLLAYFLRLFASRVEFFSMIEQRSRMRVLTLSLQANKMLVGFFFRSGFVVKATALFSLLALLGDMWHAHLSIL